MSPTLRYLGPGARFRMPTYDIDAADGEAFDVPPDATIDISEEDESADLVSLSEYLALHADGEFETVSNPYDILDENIPPIREALGTGEFDGRLDALQHAEREGEDRVGVHEAIDARRAHIREDAEPDEDVDVPGVDSETTAEPTTADTDAGGSAVPSDTDDSETDDDPVPDPEDR